MALISIIIPMYNVERYISRCLESCINQTLNNIEILIINDCGSDSSLKIAQSYAKKDCRIRIVNNTTNQGTFNARLQGIKEASGIYLLFLDADDFLAKEACEVALKKAISSVDSHEVNLPLGNHCIDLAFRHKARTQSPLSLCAKNSTSKTADTRILRETQGNSVKSMESNAESLESSLRGDNSPKQSIESCEAQPTLAPLRGAKKERKGGSSASALLELEAENSEALPLKAKKQSFLARSGSGEEGAALFAKKSDYINENISAESRRSERVESFTKNAESHIECLKDSSDSAESTKDFNIIDCHANPCGLSRNDDSIASSLRGQRPKQSI